VIQAPRWSWSGLDTHVCGQREVCPVHRCDCCGHWTNAPTAHRLL
jgi:hypothetical protein